jgi:tetratricopeptide (TPR) repeat protein
VQFPHSASLRLIPLLALAAMLTACSARRPAPVTAPTPAPASVPVPAAPPPVDIGALIERGCFSCLQRALAQGRLQNAPAFVFEAAALLTLRAKELGLPYQEWLDIATAAAQDDAGRAGLLEVVAAIPPDALSGIRDETFSIVRKLRAPDVTSWIDRVQTGPGSSALRGYLALALQCSGAGRVEKPEGTVPGTVREVPLIKYRLGLCGNAYANELRAVRATDPEFVDVDYPLGRYARQLFPYPDIDEALRRLQGAAAAFPASPAIAFSLGDVFEAIEEWTPALRAYDAVLALVADHPDALRGRLVSLSGLNDHPAAIETATRMMEGQWFLGDAYYWRAWNHLQLGNLDVARTDGDRMKSLRVNSRVYLLSGLIDWRLRRLQSAEAEFERSITMDAGQCEAATFLGGVRNELGKSREALAGFTFAKQCWELNITLRREAIRVLLASEAPESTKTREIARHERGIAQAEKRRDEAAHGIDLLQKYLTAIQAPQTPRRP